MIKQMTEGYYLLWWLGEIDTLSLFGENLDGSEWEAPKDEAIQAAKNLITERQEAIDLLKTLWETNPVSEKEGWYDVLAERLKTVPEKQAHCITCGNPMPKNEIRCKTCHP